MYVDGTKSNKQDKGQSGENLLQRIKGGVHQIRYSNWSWVIMPYLVFLITILSYFALRSWIPSKWSELAQLSPFYLLSSAAMQCSQYHNFQNVILAACASGIGGAVFMIREFYLENARYRDRKLRNNEIPRFILLPISAIVLGPIGLALLKAGLLVVGGVEAGKEIPHYSAVITGFLLGFTYHDTLATFSRLSRRLFNKAQNEEISNNQNSAKSNAQKENDDIDREKNSEGKKDESPDGPITRRERDAVKRIEWLCVLLEQGIINEREFTKRRGILVSRIQGQ